MTIYKCILQLKTDRFRKKTQTLKIGQIHKFCNGSKIHMETLQA